MHQHLSLASNAPTFFLCGQYITNVI